MATKKKSAPKTYKGKSLRLGGGGQFSKMTDQIKSGNPGYSTAEAKAVAASIGRKKLGKAKFQKLATAGRKRAAKKK